MEKKIELENVEISVVGGHASNADGVVSVGQSGTSDELMDRFVLVKFADKECINSGSDKNVNIERDFFVMDETERKFIIMSRIAVALRKKGIFATIGMHEDGLAALHVALNSYKCDDYSVETIFSHNVTEAELLDWWSAIENGVE